ncbi:hypothetical protein [Roseobacter litoralis]|uniref:hypothetical protein n=1 Tax=Roseobacter litoralis TaxID=42443 RepID=UPI00249257B6|nr:hypothetical protein [Roseobacter litoralis]
MRTLATALLALLGSAGFGASEPIKLICKYSTPSEWPFDGDFSTRLDLESGVIEFRSMQMNIISNTDGTVFAFLLAREGLGFTLALRLEDGRFTFAEMDAERVEEYTGRCLRPIFE